MLNVNEGTILLALLLYKLGVNIKFENGFMVVNNINKPIDFIPFRVNLIAKPHLILGKLRDVDLLRYV
ncbi:hypothetical protein, partial [Acetomicrobium sp. S15 = DSM 107314]|uniref:hypothetical protein n=1 Tax=Acetomicrobium sp. S15 = DSM 107314 TaxID=2529858 RepID=UPI001E452C2F